MRKNQSVLSHRQALRAWLLSFPGLEDDELVEITASQIYLGISTSLSMRRLGEEKTKSWPGGPRPTLPR